MKTKSTITNNLMQVIGFPMTALTFYAVHSGSFLHFVLGIAGFVLFMAGLLRDAK